MKDITLKIKGTQFIGDKEEEQMEFITDGKLYFKNDSLYVIYDESDVSGFGGCKTTLKLGSDSVRMKRIGDEGYGAELYFEAGKRFGSTYNTPYGQLGIEVLTKYVKNDINPIELKGQVDIGYDISLSGMQEARNKLTIYIS